MVAERKKLAGGIRDHDSGTAYQMERDRKRLSMHEGIAPWCDCCVCEAEPYWADVAEEMGISLSDYEGE